MATGKVFEAWVNEYGFLDIIFDKHQGTANRFDFVKAKKLIEVKLKENDNPLVKYNYNNSNLCCVLLRDAIITYEDCTILSIKLDDIHLEKVLPFVKYYLV